MIHQLPAPIRGATHADIFEGLDQHGSFFLRYRLGTVDGNGEFVEDPMLNPHCTRCLAAGAQRTAFDAFVKQQVEANGGTHLPGRYRVPDDAIAYFDTHGLWDLSVAAPEAE